MPPKGLERRAPCNLYLPVSLIDELQEEADRQDMALSRLVERFLRKGIASGTESPPGSWEAPGKDKKPKPKHKPYGEHGRGPAGDQRDDANAPDIRPRPGRAYRSRLMALRDSPEYWAATPKVRRQWQAEAAAADGEAGGYAWRQLDPLEEGSDGRLNERKAYQAGYRWLDEETGTLWSPDADDDRDKETPDHPEREDASDADHADARIEEKVDASTQ